MKRRLTIALGLALMMGSVAGAQERVPLPAPDGNQQGLQAVPRPANPDNGAPPPSSPVPYNGTTTDVPPAPAGNLPPWANPMGTGPAPYPASSMSRHSLHSYDTANDPFLWFNFEGLSWWSKTQPISIPLVTTGPASMGSSAGALGAPGTTSLDNKLLNDGQGGFRMTVGGWFDGGHSIGLEGGFFVLGEQNAGYTVTDKSGVGTLVINMPVNGAPFNTQVSYPGVSTGNVQVDTHSSLGGFDLNLKYNLLRANNLTVNLLGGYRFVELDETLNITGNSAVFVTTNFTDNFGNTLVTADPGSTICTFDQFKTTNTFNGGQLGTDFRYNYGKIILGGFVKCAIGDMHEVVNITGSTNVTPLNGNPVTLNGGNYATLQVGRYTVDKFAVVPEGMLSVGYALTPCVTASIGYNVLFLSSVARPGNQIDNTYDGLNHPGVPMTNSSYWTQGLTWGLQLKF